MPDKTAETFNCQIMAEISSICRYMFTLLRAILYKSANPMFVQGHIY